MKDRLSLTIGCLLAAFALWPSGLGAQSSGCLYAIQSVADCPGCNDGSQATVYVCGSVAAQAYCGGVPFAGFLLLPGRDQGSRVQC
jgi:hypothetical protein